ncbi:MAG: DNA-binding protein WhiA [Firmicutes bacterium]|nr:DNA-binding protein WhiA [Bacillota bacterium]
MSFSSEVKDELLHISDTARHCQIAELTAFLNLCGYYDGDKLVFVFENTKLLEKTSALVETLTGIRPEIMLYENKFCARISSHKDAEKLANITLGSQDYDAPAINPLAVSSVCCKRAYIRGAFICSGSVSDPQKQYHLEFSNSDYDHARALKALISSFGIDAKIITRKNHYIVYIKDGEQIVDMLNVMSAHRALLEFENLRVVKDLRNNVNRIVNCETANLNKVVSTGVRQVEAIEYIKKTVGLSYLSPGLEEMARVRLDHPDVSLKELGEKLKPPVGKSGVNHRLKKICEIAENLKGEYLNG